MPSINTSLRSTLCIVLLIFSSIISKLEGTVLGQNCAVSTTAVSPSCFGGTNGQLIASFNQYCQDCIDANVAVYYWTLFNSTTNAVIQTATSTTSSVTFNNLGVGGYSVECYTSQIEQQNGSWCAQGGGSVSSVSQLIVNTQQTNILCNSQNTGQIIINVCGGTVGPPAAGTCRGYSVFWTGPTAPPLNFGLNCPAEISATSSSCSTGGGSYTMSNLSAGTYNITISDYANCQYNATIIINEPPPITPQFTITNATCANGTGSIVIGGLGAQDGTPGLNGGFNVAWQLTGGTLNNPAGLEIQAPGFLNYVIPQTLPYPPLIPGTYAFTITDNNGCVNTSQQTINFSSPSPIISGNPQMCAGTTQQLSITNNQPPAAGNAWSSNSASVSVNASTGVATAVSPGTATITYTSSTGCIGTFQITVNSTPAFTLSNPPTLCAGQSASITATSTPNIYNYVWNTTPVTTQNGVSTSSVTLSPGATTNYTVTATNATTGCSSSQNTTVTVNPLPVISGGTDICLNAQSQLTGTATAANNNAWVSNNTGVATISPTGLVTAVSIGTAQITYTNTLGCSNSVTVNIVAFPIITGPSAVCVGSTVQLNGSGTAASWTSSNLAVATVNATGQVSGISVGNATITYVTNTGCSNTINISVNPIPTITGLNSVCVNSTITLTGSGTTASWSSSNNSIATVSSLGVVTGVSAGTVSITYTNNFGCSASTSVTVNANPVITGANNLCLNGTLQLNGNGTAAANSAWISSNTGVATISNTGLISGISVGTSNITYTNLAGCSSSLTITVNPIPTITGNIPLCVGQTNTLIGTGTPAPTSPWSSSAPLIASINNLGVITALGQGQTTITYTTNLGCSASVPVQVNANPSISGNLTLCVNNTSQLTGSATAALNTPWISSNTGVATISANGLITAILAGNTTITYTNNNGCQVTSLVTVYSNPIITGNTSLCIGNTLTLTGNGTAAANNAWISSNTAVATISNLGVVSGISAGNTTITYTNNNGCSSTIQVTVNALPTVTGNSSLCIGATSQLTGSATASSWASNAVGVATVSNTGFVNAVSAGSANITYTNTNGCAVVLPVTVFANPTISGGVSLCVSNTLQLTGSGTAAAANAWASSNTAVATISNTGLITAITAGTSTITYVNNNNCSVTSTITVNALPSITGNNTLCAGSSTQLTGSPTPAVTNAWSSSNTAVATVSNTGNVNAVSAGSVVITYTNNVGCITNINFTVNPNPTVSGNTVLCVNTTSQLTGSGIPAVSTPWTSSNTGVATVSSNGLISAISLGTSTITFTNSGGCAITTTVNVTNPVVPTFNQIPSICEGGSFQFPNSSLNSIQGTWTPAINNLATTVYTFTPNNGQCASTATMTVTVNTLPTIAGNNPICVGASLPLTGTGTPNNSNPWVSGSPSIATVNSNGSVIGVSAGTANITYTNNLGCTATVTVTINANPTISGNLTLCANSTTQLNGSPTPAIVTPWTSSTTAVATINGTGLVTAVSNGTSLITYTNSLGCSSTATVTVNANPTISGNNTVCVGGSITLTGTATPAVSNPWISSNTAVATISNLGVVTGISAGNTTITYTNNNGCSSTIQITVNALPTVTGNYSLCIGATSQLTGSATASSWASNAVGVATVSNTGLVNAVSAGSANITYTNSNGCAVVLPVTVFANPTISGGVSLCVSNTLQLTGSGTAAAANAWASSNTAVATISNTGLITAITAGTITITYINNNNCSVTSTITVNAIPSITGNNTLCAGSSTQLTGSPTPAVTNAWSSSNTAVATINNSGVLNGLTNGNVVITYTNNVGCSDNFNVSVNSLTIPVFSQLGPFCLNGTPLSLPATSNNGAIAGTWSPAAISTAAVGNTTYNFTPSSTTTPTCATNASMAITIAPLPTATISGTTTVCQNSAQPNITFTGANAAPPYTFNYTINDGTNTTNNSVTTNGAATSVTVPAPTTVSGSFTYAITSVAVGSCSNNVAGQTAIVTVNPNIVPTFDPVGPYCNGTSIPALPTTSNNIGGGIAGTWSPAINNAALGATAVQTSYTFTPTAGAGICATQTTLSITVHPNTTPTFTQLGPYCQSGTPASLPATSNNGGIAGTWSPAAISTAAVGNTTYNFTPSSTTTPTCATNASMAITIAPLPTATISGTTTVCQNSAQPNITFTGANAAPPYTFNYTINDGTNTTNNSVTTNGAATSVTVPAPTTVSGSFTYAITSVAVGSCSNNVAGQTAIVTVNPNIVPTFDPVGPYCNGTSIPALPTTSNNIGGGIAGTWSPAINNAALGATAVQTSYTFTPTAGAGICATQTTLSITVHPNTTPTFTQLGPYCQSGTPASLPATSNNGGIAGTWSPAAISTAAVGNTTYNFTPSSTTTPTCATNASMAITIAPLPTATISGTTTVCQNSAQPNITFTGANAAPPYTFNYTINDGTNTTNNSVTTNGAATSVTVPAPTTVSGSFTYAITSVAVGSCSNNVAGQTAIVTVNPNIVPTFDPVGPYCNGTSIPALPTTSNNIGGGIAGTWSPAINNAALGATAVQTSYTFTPTAGAGICATQTTLSITVHPNTTPTFTQLGPYCQSGTPASLPATSNNGGIAGTWSPAAISTAAVGNTTYNFTPSSTTTPTCATNASMAITIAPLPTATISGTTTVCQNSAQPNITFTGANAAPPYTFNYTINDGTNTTNNSVTTNGAATSVTVPAPTTVSGSFTYAITSVAVGSCSNNVAGQTAIVTVNPNIVPTFDPVGPYCNGTSIPALPTTSNNIGGGIAGTWSPAINNAALGATAVQTSYTFTPTAGAGICATQTTLSITVHPNTTPTFTQLGPYCQSGTPASLPATSNNGGIAGTWSPAAISTAAVGNTTYNFTPSSTTTPTCATNASMAITIAPLPTATISGTTTVCQNSAQPNITFTGANAAPPYTFNYTINDGTNTTNNSVTTNGAATSVTVPAPTTVSGSFTYAITSVAVGSCSNNVAGQTAIVTVNPNIVPTFDPVGPYCNGTSIPALPTTSNNIGGGIAGTWSPAINNAALGATAVQTSYTFTPTAGAGICATQTTLSITVHPNTTPTFTQLGPYCQSGTPASLPATSNNGGIAGTWSPAAISTAAVGNTTYNFTPSSTTTPTCATNASMAITIAPLPTATISGTTTVCQNSAQPNITFTGANAAPPYTFNYTINDGTNTTNNSVTTNGAATSVTVPAPTTVSGSFTYAITSVAVGSCSNNVAGQTAIVTVNPNIVPTFDPVGPYCNGTSIPALPTTSNNIGGGIAGTWSPAINNAALGATAVQTSYTFTPTAGAGICATQTTLSITVHPNTTPTFTQLGPYCQSGTPASLPATSNNGGIAGTWSPAAISTAAVGNTTYNFTPSSTTTPTCATNASMAITIAPLPTATISGTTTVCQNSAQPNITFTGANAAPPYTFNYTINDGTNTTNNSVTTNGAATSVTVPAPTTVSGSFTYAITSVAVGSCSNNVAGQTAIVTINPIPVLDIQDQSICGGSSTTIIGNATPPNGVYTWSGGAIPANFQNNQITLNPTTTTSYQVSYTLNNCSSNDNFTITVIQNPTASVLNDTICLGQSTTLVANPNGATYNWTGSNITSATNQQQVTVNPTSTTTYTVVTQIGSCPTSTATATVVVNPIPTVQAAPPQTICDGQSVTIGSTTSPPNGTYSWTPNGTNASLTVTPTLANPTQQQSFTYSVTYTLNGCPSLPSSTTITVNPKPTISVNNLNLCSGASDTIEANPNLSGGTYYWSTGISGLLDSAIIVSHITNPPNQITTYNYNAWYILNGCSSDTIPTVVTVSPIPVITTSNPSPSCSGLALNIPLTSNTAGSTFSWYASANSNVLGESVSPQPTNTINDVLTISPTPGVETVNYFAINSFNGCADTFQLNVVVNPAPFVNTINDIICSGGSFDTIPNPNAIGNFIPLGTTYSWTVATNNLVLNETASPNQNPNIFNTGPLTSSSITNTTLVYSVTPTAGACPGPVFNVNITVTPTPSISNQLDSICSGNFPTITGLPGNVIPATALYTWTIVSDNPNINGQSNQGVGVSDLSNQVLVNQTNIPQNLTYSVTPSSGPCPGSPFTLTVTVNPGPSLDTALYTICSGNSLTVTLGQGNDIIPVGTTFIWNVMPNTNITGQTSNNIPSPNFFTGTLQNSQSVNDTLEYWLTPTGPANQNPQCNGSPFPVFVVVKPTPSLSNTLLNDICSGLSFTYDPNQNLTPSSIYNANTVLSWTVTPNANVSGWSNSVGTNNPTITQTLTNLTNTVQAVVYNVTAADTLSLCTSSTFTVTVNVQPTPTIQPQTASVCSGNAFVITPSITNNQPSQIVPNGILYSWPNPVSTPANLISGGSAQSNQVSISQVLNIQPPIPPQFGTLVYNVTPSYPVSNNLTCSGQPFTVTVNVNPIPIIDTAFAQPDTICFGSISTLQAMGLPTLSPPNGIYNWTPAAQISGAATGQTITTLPLNTTTTFIVTYTLPANLGSCQSQAYPVTVTVQAPPNISTITAVETEFCVGGCTNITANFVGAVAVDSVQWSTGQVTYFFPHSIQVCPNDTTTYTATAFLGGCNGNIANITLNVNADPLISTQPYTDTTICVGGTLPLSVQVSGGAGLPIYQWYQNQINSNIGGTLLPSPPPFGSSYQPQPFNTPGSFYYYCVISYAPSGCGFLTSLPSEINVISDPIVQIIGQDETLCIGGTPQCINAVISGGIGSSTLTWNQGGSNPTFCPPNIPIGIEDYTVSVQQSGIGCFSNSTDTITVTILPDPVVSIAGINEVCVGAQVQLTGTVTGGFGSVSSYQWAESNPTGAPFTNIPNSNNYSIITPPLVNNITYQLSIIQDIEGCDGDTSIAISVYPDPVIEIETDPYSCLGSMHDVESIITGGTPTSTNQFTWYLYNVSMSDSVLEQGPNPLSSMSYLSTGDTNVVVYMVNSGYGCDLAVDTTFVNAIYPAIANFEPSSSVQSFFNPTFDFVNTSENATDYYWDLGECDPSLDFSELFTTPSSYYDPNSVNILGYTYGCPPGVYDIQLIASNMGYCPDTTIISIRIESDALLYVPNSFTPDGKELNNYFYPVFSHAIDPEDYVFRIYNRWGEIIFETHELPSIPTTSSNTLGAWNGDAPRPYGGKVKSAQDQVYTWEVYYKLPNADNPKRVVGHVTVLR